MGAALPRAVRVAKIHCHAGFFGEFFVQRHLPVLGLRLTGVAQAGHELAAQLAYALGVDELVVVSLASIASTSTTRAVSPNCRPMPMRAAVTTSLA